MSELMLHNILSNFFALKPRPETLATHDRPPAYSGRCWGNADPNEPLGLHAVEEDVEVLLHCSQGMLDP